MVLKDRSLAILRMIFLNKEKWKFVRQLSTLLEYWLNDTLVNESLQIQNKIEIWETDVKNHCLSYYDTKLI